MGNRIKYGPKRKNTGKNIYFISREVDAIKNIELNQKRRTESSINQDEKVRRYVRRKMEEYVGEGHSKEEVIDLVMQQKEIVQHFSYYTKNGIDIRKIFRKWLEEPEHSNEGKER